MGFRRHLMSTVRNARRDHLKKLERIASNIGESEAGARDALLSEIDSGWWLQMSDTAGTPPAKGADVMSWANGDPEKILKDARAFLYREADLVVDRSHNAARETFAEECLSGMKTVGMASDETAECLHYLSLNVENALQTHEYYAASAEHIETVLRELCGLDGDVRARGPEAGNPDAARGVCRRLAVALDAERKAEADVPGMAP